MEHQTKKDDIGLNINTPTAILIGSIIIALAVIFSNSYKLKTTNSGAVNAPNPAPQAKDINIAPITSDDHFYGNPKAKVVMVEFSDLECPFCKRFHPTVKNIVDNSRGTVALVYRHFPLDSLHSKARNEAEASECAAELGGNDKFWEYIDAIFKITPANNGLDPAELPNIAKQIGLDTSRFNDCLSSGKYKNKIETNFRDGTTVGVNGTPTTVFMNTKGQKMLLVGAVPEEQIKAAIDSLMN